MITTRLIGGLGNQMFQYAAGRALALRRGVELRIDREDFANYPLRTYLLDGFGLNLNDARRTGPLETRLKAILPFSARQTLYEERGQRFDPAVLDLPDGAILSGYWQCERYFIDVEAAIRSDFSFRQPAPPTLAALLNAAAVEHSVSLHVRRGDYVSNPAAFAVHGICEPSYYLRALELLRERVGEHLRMLVFSDDIAWARDNLPLHGDVIWAENAGGAPPHDDLRAMAACRHHVIANSSFSWWGAWLDPRDGITIAPERWFTSAEHDATDIVPSRWLRV